MSYKNKKNNKFVIITTISMPNETEKKFSKLPNWNLIVVGDKKTPTNWILDETIFLSISKQEKLKFHILSKLPFNHYSRKMIGYLYAMKAGADFIAESDDDNLPYDDWGFPEGEEFLTTSGNLDFVNVFKYFGGKKNWPRGFPLNLVTSNKAIIKDEQISKQKVKVGIWQGLADGEPDVDAIYRLTINEPNQFEKKDPIVLGENTWCPFNTQNTLYCKELFPLLYLPSYVTFRYTDILRGLVSQPIMQIAGYKLGFTKSTVFQKRNNHDLLKDFEQELPCYLSSGKVIQVVKRVIKKKNSVSDNLLLAYQELEKFDIVKKEELLLSRLWIKDLQKILEA